MTTTWINLITMLPAAVGWPMMGHDLRRTARTPVAGQIRTPQLVWQMDFSACEYFLTVTPEVGERNLELHESSALPLLSTESRRAWGLAIPQSDVVGDGQQIDPPDAPGARWGKFLPDVTGLQRLNWTTIWGENAHFQMHSFENGIDQPRLVWDIPFEGAMYSPLVVVVDVDGDGVQEAVLSTWHGVIVHNLSNGQEKYRCMYRQSHGRQYGFFGAYTNPVGRVYLVVVGDFAGHIGVLAVRDGELRNLWFHQFDLNSEQGIDRRFTINTIGPDPIGDFDGDGRGEVVMNVFNETGDGRWHLLGYDLETGEHQLDLPDVYLHGHADVDGDGRSELLTQYCPGRPVGTNGKLRLYRWNKILKLPSWEGLGVGWDHPYARWSMTTLPQLPLTHITGATRGMETPVTGVLENRSAQTVFFTAPEEGECLNALQINSDDEVEIAWKVEGPAGVLLNAVAVFNGQILIRARAQKDAEIQLHAEGARLKAVASQRIVRDAPQPLVLHDAQKRPQIVMAEPLNRISGWIFQPSSDPPLRRLWQQPGRAMTTQVPQMLGLVAGDVDGDGFDEVLYVQETREGHSRLTALGLDGCERWHYDFPDFNGRAPVWNECGTTIWAVGHFMNPERLDVLVSNRRSIMHSDETVVLDVHSQKVAWRRDILEVKPPWTETRWPHTRGYGGGPVAITDFDGDSLDDIVLCYPSEYSIVKGNTGEQYIVETTGPLKGTDNFWVIGGWPLVADLNGDGVLETLWTSSSIILALAHRKGRAELLWSTEPNDGATGLPAIGDTNNDGRLEIGLPGFQDGFRCIDAATGEVLWTVPSQGSGASNCVAVDINGDGMEEFIYANGSQLLAVAHRPGIKQTIVWQIDLPVSAQNIVVADVDGDGESEILAGGSDGVLYCIG